jgi:hypothetical protein
MFPEAPDLVLGFASFREFQFRADFAVFGIYLL